MVIIVIMDTERAIHKSLSETRFEMTDFIILKRIIRFYKISASIIRHILHNLPELLS